MSGRVRRAGLMLIAAACVSLTTAVPATAATPAAEGTYTVGVVGQPFWLPNLDEGLTVVGAEDEDQTLVLDLDAVTDLSSPTVAGGMIKHYDVGAPHPGMGFRTFRVHADFSQAVGVSMAVRFVDAPWDDKLDDWRFAPQTGVDETGAWVYTPPPYCGGHDLMFQLVFTLVDESATGIATIADFTLDWGEWVEAPDSNDGGKSDDGKDDNGDGATKAPSGVAYMGGSDADAGGGGDETGSGSGGPGVDAGGDGSEAGGGGAGVETDAPLAADPPASAARMVTGYPLRACDVGAWTTGGSDGSGTAVGPVQGDGRSDISRGSLAWLAVALLVVGPLTAAEFNCRRLRRRLRTLVESTPDEPALRGPTLFGGVASPGYAWPERSKRPTVAWAGPR